MNMRPLLRSSLSVLVLCCILFSNFFCGIALAESSITTEQQYTFSSSRSIPSSFYVPVRVVYLDEDGNFNYSSSVNLLDDSETSIYTVTTLAGDVSDTLVGFAIDMSPYITSNRFDSISLRASQVDFWIYANSISYALSPFAAPSLAYVEYSGVYDFQIYDGSVGYERWIYDNSFTVNKPLSVEFSDFGLAYRKSNGSFSPDYILGFDMLLSSDSLVVEDLLNNLSVRNTIASYVEFTENEFTDGTFSSIEDFPTSNMRISGDRLVYYVFFTPTSDNFVSHTNPDLKFDLPNLDGFRSTFRLNTTYTNNNLTSVDVFGYEGKSYDKSVLSLVSSGFSRLASTFGSGLSDVVTNATDNADRIIENTTNKINEVKEGVTEVKDSVIETKNSILDLPNKIKEMLIGLVVPDDETINAKYAEFDELLASRFGLIYQSADIIHDFAESFQTQAVMTADTGGIITMPSVTVNLVGTPFTFGGYDVDIIPDGFEFLQQSLRLAISMVCTVVFVNMCKNKLEAILK